MNMGLLAGRRFYAEPLAAVWSLLLSVMRPFARDPSCREDNVACPPHDKP
jgi:hypothetical protein